MGEGRSKGYEGGKDAEGGRGGGRGVCVTGDDDGMDWNGSSQQPSSLIITIKQSKQSKQSKTIKTIQKGGWRTYQLFSNDEVFHIDTSPQF